MTATATPAVMPPALAAPARRTFTDDDVDTSDIVRRWFALAAGTDEVWVELEADGAVAFLTPRLSPPAEDRVAEVVVAARRSNPRIRAGDVVLAPVDGNRRQCLHRLRFASMAAVDAFAHPPTLMG